MVNHQDFRHFDNLLSMRLGKIEQKIDGGKEGEQDRGVMDFVQSAAWQIERASVLLSRVLLNQHWRAHPESESTCKEARAAISKAIKCFEKIYHTSPLSSLHENMLKLESLTDYPEMDRYRQLRVLGFLLNFLQKACLSREPRWLVGLENLYDRHAILLRNSLTLKDVKEKLGGKNFEVRERKAHLNIALTVLKGRAEANRTHYESGRNPANMEVAIRFCGSIIPLLTVLNQSTEAQDFKKKQEVWERRLHEDLEQNNSPE